MKSPAFRQSVLRFVIKIGIDLRDDDDTRLQKEILIISIGIFRIYGGE